MWRLSTIQTRCGTWEALCSGWSSILFREVLHYDVVLIDCPPPAGSTTELGILSAGWVISPAHPEPLGAAGFADGVWAVQQFAEAWQHPSAVAGVVLTKVNRTTEHRDGFEGTVDFVTQAWPRVGIRRRRSARRVRIGCLVPAHQ